jgi:hypothetical protein
VAWDDPLSPVADLVAACASAIDRTAGSMSLERLVVETPVELQALTETEGALSLGVAPPRQARETTVMPVLHRLRITVVAEG